MRNSGSGRLFRQIFNSDSGTGGNRAHQHIVEMAGIERASLPFAAMMEGGERERRGRKKRDGKKRRGRGWASPGGEHRLRTEFLGLAFASKSRDIPQFSV